VFLDRDGTVNVSPTEGDYVRTPGDFALVPDAASAIRRLNDAGFVVVVCTNQRGVARGLMTRRDLDAVHEKMTRDLARGGARLAGIYACTHGSNENCDCRKPKPGLMTRAIREHDIDVPRSFVVGDTARDVKAAAALGCRAVLIAGEDEPPAGEWTRARSLSEAADMILVSHAREAGGGMKR
jgi:histidinol-phosphate phosphatase family protein